MGGHGGLNILPQKKWNVYNFDNREKVRLDEEAAAKEEQLKREQSRRRDTELRLEKLRQARGLASQAPSQATLASQAPSQADDKPSSTPVAAEFVAEPLNSESDSKHINLFEGIRIFDPIKPGDEKRIEKRSRFARDDEQNKKVKREEVRVVGPEDEVYKLGYGVAGKGVKLPWYMEKKIADKNGDDEDDDEDSDDVKRKEKMKSGGKKTLAELREERLKRERTEKERERALMMKSKKDRGFSSWRR